MRVRVLEIIADGKPGGGSTYLLELLHGLRTRFEFGVATEGDSYLLAETLRAGFEGFGLRFFGRPPDLSIPWKLRAVVAEFRPDVVHTHGPRAGFLHALAFVPAPTVYTVHG
ncbi:MAG: glycosyltransferase family 4 protein, partial [bacterium]